MPAGRYVIVGDDGDPVGTETFRCAPGPAGWRYVSHVETQEHGHHRESIDVAVDAAWRIVRVALDSGDHRIVLEPDDGTLTGRRDGSSIDVGWGPEDHLDYLTPATNLITVRRLDGTSDIDVVFLEPFTLEAARVRQRYELVGPEEVETPVGAFAASRWMYTSLDSGWSSDLWVAGDVIVRFDRIFELVEYEPGANGPRRLR